MLGAQACALLLFPAFAGEPAQDTLPPAGTVEGRVISGNAVPVASATVALGADRRLLTDSSGSFYFTGLDPGRYPLTVRAIGYGAKTVTVSLGEKSGWRGAISLEALVQTLPEIVAAEKPWKPAEYNATSKFDNFFRRRALGSGRFLDRDAIKKSNASNLLQLLQGNLGIRVRWNPPGSNPPTFVRMPRCDRIPPHIALYIDGLRIHWDVGIQWDRGRESPEEARYRAHAAFAEAFEGIATNDIEMIEIYRSVAELPSDLPDRDVCAAVLVYTRWHGS
jgi:hypothetical protein